MSTTTRLFLAEEARGLADSVVDIRRGVARQEALVPRDRPAAVAGVERLAERHQLLPGSILDALERASDSAALLSEDRLQGLAELIQNADDAGANRVCITLDRTTSRLLVAHDGDGLSLNDVWALAIPWLSLKVDSEDKIGRFGIGLKTLQSLSTVLEVFEGHFAVRFGPDGFSALDQIVTWPADPFDGVGTTFAIPLDPTTLNVRDIAKWLAHWGEPGLIFLRHVSRITLLDMSGVSVLDLKVRREPDEQLALEHGLANRRSVTASDGRRWDVYSRLVPNAEGLVRRGKVSGILSPIALAFPRFTGDIGHIHVGLPVRQVGLPFRVSAQFDPQASRRDIADTAWNISLVTPISDLWLDASLDSFRRDPSNSWLIVPLASELAEDELNSDDFRAALETRLLTEARRALAAALLLEGGDGLLPLTRLAYEEESLTGLLSQPDIRLAGSSEGALIDGVRSSDARWRNVLTDLERLGADTPVCVDVISALVLIDGGDKPPTFVAQIVALTLLRGEGRALRGISCLVLDSGARATPQARAGLGVLLPSGPGPLWNTLEMGSRLHSAFTTHPNWTEIHSWLLTSGYVLGDASDRQCLAVLSSAGSANIGLPKPLSDAQLEALRESLEELDEADRQYLGTGIGRAVQVEATRYDSSGKREVVFARPSDAYIVERERNSWSVAAAKTPGLVWISRRYSTDLKNARGRDGVGAQRLFRLLGAESAPRIVTHPGNYKRYERFAAGVSRWEAGSPARRNKLLSEHQATYSVQDWTSPDLKDVLEDIASQDPSERRIRRAVAVLDTLARAWDRLDRYSRVMAASEDYGWVDKGQIEAWWISSAASIAWLTSESSAPSAPDDLSIRSDINVLFNGDRPEIYLHATLDVDAHRGVLSRLGVAGDPTVSQLLDKLEAIRDGTINDPLGAQDASAPIYQKLSEEVRPNGLGNLSSRAARTRFALGQGLIATNLGWRRPSVVLNGPPVFGDLRAFVPSVARTDALWRMLGIAVPAASHAEKVLAELAKDAMVEPEIMIQALRILANASEGVEETMARLKRAPVWIGDRWSASRPIYAIVNPLIAEALNGRLPIWAPGGSLSQFPSLVDAYGMTRLDTPNGAVVDPEEGLYDADLSAVFKTAVGNLRADLTASDPENEASLTLSWEHLAEFRVVALPQLRVRLVEPRWDTDETVPVDAWLSQESGILFVSDGSSAGSSRGGGYAIATAFEADPRRISHDWGAAWSAALDGLANERAKTAVRADAEQKAARDLDNLERLRALNERSHAHRNKGDRSDIKRKISPQTSPPTENVPVARLLVDPNELVVAEQSVELMEAEDPKSAPASRLPQGLKEHDPTRSKGPGAGRPAPNYTDAERETVGFEIARVVLGGDNAGVVDIRHQHNVGADAVDELRNFYELKVHRGKIPPEVSFTRSEFLRAQATPGFFLVLVGNVERGDSDPEVIIITDPLHTLTTRPSGSVALHGVFSAPRLRIPLLRKSPESL